MGWWLVILLLDAPYFGWFFNEAFRWSVFSRMIWRESVLA
jgi:hypothetical protein